MCVEKKFFGKTLRVPPVAEVVLLGLAVGLLFRNFLNGFLVDDNIFFIWYSSL
jgi:hypothetical protein